jgi:hypothetical protein
MQSARSVADVLAQQMAVYLGPHTARVAVKTFSLKALGRGPETLTVGDVPAVTKALRPMLRTLVGRVTCEVIIEQINRDLEIKA